MDGGGQSVMIFSASQMLMLSANNLAIRELAHMEVLEPLGIIHLAKN